VVEVEKKLVLLTGGLKTVGDGSNAFVAVAA